MKSLIRHIVYTVSRFLLPELGFLRQLETERKNNVKDSIFESPVKVYPNCRIVQSEVGKYTYISEGSLISLTRIGRFCSIGPGLLCGYGIHPINGISTSPMFYSTKKQNGITLSASDKTEERKQINIGHDVYIGANVTILDGVSIGNGAVIAAGSVVNKDVPAYAVVGGVPIRLIKYRFDENQIAAMEKIQWWNWTDDQLQQVEQEFFNCSGFIQSHLQQI